ncbi:hypothetical protein [Pantoea ananatis]|uniref:hypothetical protein n=1 Tax=Pantoea ananas TaxID=553 RepID=UPI001B3028CA|nr:hypothetical protein [Pantoea ananatis]
MALQDVKFDIVITFDITVDGRSSIYSQVTELLSDKGFSKETVEGIPFPQNIYLGVTSKKVEVEDSGTLLVSNLKAATKAISERISELLEEIFDTKDVQNKIFVHVSRKETSTTLVE